jgi:FkbM family methyltransferase
VSIAGKALRQSRTILEQRAVGTGAGALARAWAWQLWRRASGRPALIRCIDGSLLIAPPWSRTGSMIAATGLTERDDGLLFLDLLRPGDLFVDVGANIGFYTLLAARRGAHVEAFEPSAQAAANCERSLALNGLRANVHRAACGASAGSVRFSTGLDVHNHVVAEGGVEVPMVTLDEQLEGASAQLAVLKVDAEGHDIEVLRGALGALQRLLPLVLVEIWTGGNAPFELLSPFAYASYVYDPDRGELEQVPVGHRRAGNMLLIPDARVELVRARLGERRRPRLRPPRISPYRG